MPETRELTARQLKKRHHDVDADNERHQRHQRQRRHRQVLRKSTTTKATTQSEEEEEQQHRRYQHRSDPPISAQAQQQQQREEQQQLLTATTITTTTTAATTSIITTTTARLSDLTTTTTTPPFIATPQRAYSTSSPATTPSSSPSSSPSPSTTSNSTWRSHSHLHLILVIILACCTPCGNSMPDGRATCRSVPGLTKDQLELCYKASDVTAAALEGLDMAIRECQVQFQWHRWNCSSLSNKSRNPHASNLLKKGYRESAFAYAISAAGIAHSVARACSQGRLMTCGCDPSVNRKTLNKNLRQSLDKEKKLFLQYLEVNQILTPQDEKKYERAKIASRWKWGGCSHNMDFGVEYSKLFLDCREKAGDIQSKINLHNNHAGRIAVSNNMEFRCKCHGMSGSCQLKTCWKSAPDFHVVGKVLKHQFRKALLVDQSNLGNGEPIVVLKRARNKKSNGAGGGGNNGEHVGGGVSALAELDRVGAGGGGSGGGGGGERTTRKTNTDKSAQRSARKLETSLFYYQRSPSFCERDLSADIQGTVGRRCNRNATTSDGCTSLCCGRGHRQVKERRAERCRCKFQWCCNVVCDECHVEEWISVCN